MANELFIPSIEACAAFGINRKGVKKVNFTEKYSFLNGPQFADLKIYEEEQDMEEKYKNCLDEVIVKFLGNTPIALVPKKDPSGIVKMEYNSSKVSEAIENPLYTIRIIPPNPSWLEFNINHKWDENEGVVSKVLETIQETVDSVAGVVQTLKNVGDPKNPIAIKKILTDKQDQYISTDKISFNIPFILFTSGKATSGEKEKDFVDRWLRDIFKPLVLLTTWTYPKRATEITLSDGTKVSQDSINPDPSAPDRLKDKSNSNKSVQEKLLEISSMYPGVRVAIMEPPSYIAIEHSAGFFRFDVCAIEKISYKFEGPWIRASVSEESLEQSINNENFKTTRSRILEVSLPLVVSGSISVRVIEKLYADDWISMFEKSPLLKLRQGGKDIISVTKNRYQQRK